MSIMSAANFACWYDHHADLLTDTICPASLQNETISFCEAMPQCAGATSSGFKTVLVQPAAQGCHALVQDLEPGTQYSFQVYAINTEGASPASSTGIPSGLLVKCIDKHIAHAPVSTAYCPDNVADDLPLAALLLC